MESENTNKYKLNIDTERDYSMKNVIDKWIKYNAICPSCNKYSLKLKKFQTIANLLKLQCINYKYRKIISLRDNLFLHFILKLQYPH